VLVNCFVNHIGYSSLFNKVGFSFFKQEKLVELEEATVVVKYVILWHAYCLFSYCSVLIIQLPA
jgi:hypothetical protein